MAEFSTLAESSGYPVSVSLVLRVVFWPWLTLVSWLQVLENSRPPESPNFIWPSASGFAMPTPSGAVTDMTLASVSAASANSKAVLTLLLLLEDRLRTTWSGSVNSTEEAPAQPSGLSVRFSEGTGGAPSM
ncbi:hypothetical protein ACIF6L_38350 [Kitasatospora sp. NPDC086009]|uniref:hypothetical protein n=1 Tax=unclassified Kitasatospora TaxID=2633591 RepID=UPI0037C6D100